MPTPHCWWDVKVSPPKRYLNCWLWKSTRSPCWHRRAGRQNFPGDKWVVRLHKIWSSGRVKAFRLDRKVCLSNFTPGGKRPCFAGKIIVYSKTTSSSETMLSRASAVVVRQASPSIRTYHMCFTLVGMQVYGCLPKALVIPVLSCPEESCRNMKPTTSSHMERAGWTNILASLHQAFQHHCKLTPLGNHPIRFQ